MTRAVITYFPSRRTIEPVDTPPIPPQKTTEGRTSSRAHTESSSLVIVYLGSWTLASHCSNVALWSSGRTSGSADLTDWRGRAAAKAKLLPLKTDSEFALPPTEASDVPSRPAASFAGRRLSLKSKAATSALSDSDNSNISSGFCWSSSIDSMSPEVKT